MAKRTKAPETNAVPVSHAGAKDARLPASHDGGTAGEAPQMGRPRMTFSNLQVSESLRLLLEGKGRVYVCAIMKISYKTFQRYMRENPEYADQVRLCEQSRMESCEANLFRLATREYDAAFIVRAAIAYLGRRDKIKAMVRAKKAKRVRDDNAFRLKAAKITGAKLDYIDTNRPFGK